MVFAIESYERINDYLIILEYDTRRYEIRDDTKRNERTLETKISRNFIKQKFEFDPNFVV